MRASFFCAAIAILGGGCYSPRLGSGAMYCSTEGRCPAGFYCAVDGRCWKPGEGEIGRSPALLKGGIVSAGGAMRSQSYRLVGGFGTTQRSPRLASPGYVVVDGIVGQSRDN